MQQVGVSQNWLNFHAFPILYQNSVKQLKANLYHLQVNISWIRKSCSKNPKALPKSFNNFKKKSKRKYLPSANKKSPKPQFSLKTKTTFLLGVCTTTKLSISLALVTSNGKLSRKENSFSSQKNATNLLSQSFSGKSYHQHERQRLMFRHSGSYFEKAPFPHPQKVRLSVTKFGELVFGLMVTVMELPPTAQQPREVATPCKVGQRQ